MVTVTTPPVLKVTRNQNTFWQIICGSDIDLCQILSFEGGEVFKADITVFNDATKGANYFDMQCVDTKVELNTGCMKVIFLNKFVQDMLVSITTGPSVL